MRRHPGIAAVLSFFITGLGQIYNGEIAKGIFLFVLYSISAFACLILIGYVTTPIIWIYGIYDAYTSAARYHHGR